MALHSRSLRHGSLRQSSLKPCPGKSVRGKTWNLLLKCCQPRFSDILAIRRNPGSIFLTIKTLPDPEITSLPLETPGRIPNNRDDIVGSRERFNHPEKHAKRRHDILKAYITAVGETRQKGAQLYLVDFEAEDFAPRAKTLSAGG